MVPISVISAVVKVQSVHKYHKTRLMAIAKKSSMNAEVVLLQVDGIFLHQDNNKELH